MFVGVTLTATGDNLRGLTAETRLTYAQHTVKTELSYKDLSRFAKLSGTGSLNGLNACVKTFQAAK